MWSQEGTSLETAALAHGWDRLLWSPLSHTAYFLPAERMDVTHIFMCSFSHHSVYEYQVLFVTCFLSMLFLTLKIYFSCFKHIYILTKCLHGYSVEILFQHKHFNSGWRTCMHPAGSVKLGLHRQLWTWIGNAYLGKTGSYHGEEMLQCVIS